MELNHTVVFISTTEPSVFKVKCDEDDEGNYMQCNVKRVSDSYLLTKAELEGIIGSAFDKGFSAAGDLEFGYNAETKESIIKSMLP